MWASADRYSRMCWTRDFGFSVPGIIASGNGDAVRVHLRELARRQAPSGRIPVWFFDGAFRASCSRLLRIEHNLLLVPRLFTKAPISWLHSIAARFGSPHHAGDSELHFAIAVKEYADKTRDINFPLSVRDSAHRAIEYVEDHLLEDGLVSGTDWRDVDYHLLGATLLSNNCLFYRALKLWGRDEDAESVKQLVRKKFLRGMWFADRPNSEEFELSGNALAILSGVAEREEALWILECSKVYEREFGFISPGVDLPPQNFRERAISKKILSENSGRVFSLVNGLLMLAALKDGFPDFARDIFEKRSRISDFPEWIDPFHGSSQGARTFLWDASMYLEAAQALSR